MDFQSLIFNSAPFAMVPASVLAIISLRSGNITIRILSIHILISSIVEVASAITWSMKINNIFILHLYTIEEFALISWFYATVILGKGWKLFFLLSVLLFTVLTLLNSAFLQPLTVNNTYARALESLICLVYAMICFHKLINVYSTILPKPYLTALLLINSGILIYFSSSCLLFILSNYLRKPGLTDVRMMLWTFHAFFCSIYYLLLFFGLWIIRKAKLYTFYLQVQ
ncbi:hypothetical protein [Pedobacter sp. L105]|uniref:hypothetical protein n=1 Tax=Pedobacter sp. L105 TaxID=1641871 RepID=UPI00131A8F6D|nr:hypothetical protein [Pedobacter sp. L105]